MPKAVYAAGVLVTAIVASAFNSGDLPWLRSLTIAIGRRHGGIPVIRLPF
jgi:hypothetical protein